MKIKDVLLESDEEHQKALDATGFWGKQAAGCIFLAADTGRLCLAHRSRNVEQPGTWGTWGGAIDEGEDPSRACMREVKEESGYSGPAKMVPLYVFSHDSGFRYYNFLAVVASEFTPVLDWETQGSKWFDFGKWPKPLHPGMVSVLQDPASVKVIKSYAAKAASKTKVAETFLGDHPSFETLFEKKKPEHEEDDYESSTLPKYTPNDEKKVHSGNAVQRAGNKSLNSIIDYTDDSSRLSRFLHDHYRGNAKDDPEMVKWIMALDEVFKDHKIKSDLYVYTGIPDSPAVAWKKYGADTTKPIRLHLPAYTSTSTSFGVAQDFGRNIPVPKTYTPRNEKAPNPFKDKRKKTISSKQMMVIHIPAGHPGVSVASVGSHRSENEIVLARGTEILVDPKPTVLSGWTPIYVWHAEIVGHNPVQVVVPQDLI